MTTIVRPLEQTDHAEWRSLWTAYLEFYETTLPEDVYASTWRRLFTAGEFEPKALIAIADGKAVGLVHYLFHRTCWSVADNCYLQDLFVDPAMRGTGAGRALIEAVQQAAAQAGVTNVYWMTRQDNETARRLYDRVAKHTGFIKYAM